VTESKFLQAKAILFDLDGTLVETDNRWADVLTEKLFPLKRLFPGLDTRRLARQLIMSIEMPANYAISILERLGLSHLLSGMADRVRRSKGLATREGSQPVPGTHDMLDALQSRYQMAVVTTRARREALAFIEQLDVDSYFPVVVTRQDVLRMKPHPEPVYTAAKAIHVDPRYCVMVGDTVMDVRAAKRAGAVAVGVLSGFGDRRELERAGADLVLDRACQLLDYLDNGHNA